MKMVIQELQCQLGNSKYVRAENEQRLSELREYVEESNQIEREIASRIQYEEELESAIKILRREQS